MIKKAWIIITILITLQTYSMETQLCSFANVPSDILNRIGQFLMEPIESQEEFIERTNKEQTLSKLPEPHNRYFPYISGQWRGSCPYGTKIAILEPMEKSPFSSLLTIVDLTKKKKEEAILYNQEIQQGYCIAIAPSAHASMIATIQSIPQAAKLSRSHNTNRIQATIDRYHDYLIVQNLTTNKIRTIDMSKLDGNYFCKIHSIAFNKQGTHIIIWGLTSLTFENTHHSIINIHETAMELNNPTQFVKYHLIFPLTMAKPTTRPITEKKNLLLDYFRQKIICKEISTPTAL